MHSNSSQQIITELKNCCKDLTTDEADKLLYAFDATKTPITPDFIAFPSSTQEVSALLKVCTKYKIPVTPRGAGTGFAGGSVPSKGGLVIVLTKMNRLLTINRDALFVEVEPGIINAELGKLLKEKGLFYPPDPASLKSSTIGGNVSTGAGGPSAVKYGVTGDFVMGIKAVLPNGDILETGVKTDKGVVGYDLKKLFVGSEGTLGVITKIRLKVLPLPEAVITASAVFKNRNDAVNAVTTILHASIRPRTLEYIDKSAINSVENFIHGGLPVTAGAMLLIETDGDIDSAKAEMESIKLLCNSFNVSSFDIADSQQEVEEQWKVRRSISASLQRLRPTKLNEDISVPRNKIATLMEKLDELSQKTGLPIINFGHAGDGNIHVNVMTDKSNQEEYKLALKTVDEIFDITLELDGTLSGEHGVGLAKKPYISKELSKTAIDFSKTIKRAVDPDNIMNPEKIFPPT